MQYYKTRYVPNNFTFIIVGDVDAETVHQQLTGVLPPEKSLSRCSPHGTAATVEARASELPRAIASLTGMAHPGGHEPGRTRA